jgi:hypothetical protein
MKIFFEENSNDIVEGDKDDESYESAAFLASYRMPDLWEALAGIVDWVKGRGLPDFSTRDQKLRSYYVGKFLDTKKGQYLVEVNDAVVEGAPVEVL